MLTKAEINNLFDISYLSLEKAQNISSRSSRAVNFDEIYFSDLISDAYEREKLEFCKARQCFTEPNSQPTANRPGYPNAPADRAHISLLREPFGCGFAAVKTPSLGLVLIHGFDNFGDAQHRFYVSPSRDSKEYVNVWAPRDPRQSTNGIIAEVLVLPCHRDLTKLELLQLSFAYNFHLLKCVDRHAILFVPFMLRAFKKYLAGNLVQQMEGLAVSQQGMEELQCLIEATTKGHCPADVVNCGLRLCASENVYNVVARLAVEQEYWSYFHKLFPAIYKQEWVRNQMEEVQMVYFSVLPRVYAHFKFPSHHLLKLFVGIGELSTQMTSYLKNLPILVRQTRMTLMDVLTFSYSRQGVDLFLLDEIAEVVSQQTIEEECKIRKARVGGFEVGQLQVATQNAITKSKRRVSALLCAIDSPVRVLTPEEG